MLVAFQGSHLAGSSERLMHALVKLPRTSYQNHYLISVKSQQKVTKFFSDILNPSISIVIFRPTFFTDEVYQEIKKNYPGNYVTLTTFFLVLLYGILILTIRLFWCRSFVEAANTVILRYIRPSKYQWKNKMLLRALVASDALSKLSEELHILKSSLTIYTQQYRKSNIFRHM